MHQDTIQGIVGAAHMQLCDSWMAPLGKQSASEAEQKKLRHNDTKAVLRSLFRLGDGTPDKRITLTLLRCLGVVVTPDLTEEQLDISPGKLAVAIDTLPSVERCNCRDIPLSEKASMMALADYM